MENDSKQYTIKICPECGRDFSCFGDNDCWCEKIRLHRKDMVQILQKYADCLCPDCLKKYESI